MVQIEHRRFTIPEYYRMAEIGVLPMESHQVELLDGVIYLRWSNDDRPAGSKRLFTVDEYEQLVSEGILTEDEKVELLEGEIIEMVPTGSHHSGTVKFLSAFLNQRLGTSVVIGVQDPIRLPPYSEPEPDISVMKPRADYYRSETPSAGDVLFLIEVADSSASTDRAVKLPMYATAGIPEVWIVDLTDDSVAVHRGPSEGGYAESSIARRGDSLSPSAFPDLTIAVNDILG